MRNYFARYFALHFGLGIALASQVSFATKLPDCTKIGILGEFKSLTRGFYQHFGTETRRGAEVAVKWLKQKNARAVCFEFENFETDNSVANLPRIIRNAAANGFRLFIGLGISDQAMGAKKVLEETGAILISPTASSTELLGQQGRIVVVYPTNQIIGHSLAQQARARGIEKILSVYVSRGRYSEDMHRHFSDEFIRSGGTLETVSIRPQNSNFNEVVEKIKKNNFQFVFAPLFEVDAARLIAAVARHSENIEYVGTDSWGTYSKVIRRLVKNEKLKAMVPKIYDPEFKTAENQYLVSEFAKGNGSKLPTDLVAFSFDSMLIAHALVQNCPKLTARANVANCLSLSLPISSTMGLLKTHENLGIKREIQTKMILFDDPNLQVNVR
jgi:ABC-type branched-subunit amino acid transport system substrate-binding protein